MLYKNISPDQVAWPHKIEDGIRYHLLNQNYLEAWRLFQVAKRTGTSIHDLAYYGLLSTLLAGSCPLAMEAADDSRDLLVMAYMIRNHERFRGDYMVSVYDERKTHLSNVLFAKTRQSPA